MKILDPDDEAIEIVIRKDQHKVTIRDESETRQTILIEPLPDPPKKDENL